MCTLDLDPSLAYLTKPGTSNVKPALPGNENTSPGIRHAIPLGGCYN
jgi:hypothetical protein